MQLTFQRLSGKILNELFHGIIRSTLARIDNPTHLQPKWGAVETLLVSKRAAAEVLSISVRSVERLIAHGKLPSVRVGGLVRIPVEALYAMARAS